MVSIYFLYQEIPIQPSIRPAFKIQRANVQSIDSDSTRVGNNSGAKITRSQWFVWHRHQSGMDIYNNECVF